MDKNPLLHIDKVKAESLVEKWAPVLDYTSDKVSPITNDHIRLSTAMLLENQEKWCFEASNISGGGGSVFGSAVPGAGLGGASVPNGDSYAPNDARLPKVLIPMIRRTFPELITNEIVGVQPMSGPVGLAFALRYRYENEALGLSNNGSDGLLTNPMDNRRLGGSPQGKEIGYNYLNTTFTGTSSAQLSGLTNVFPMAVEDSGVANLISQFELTSKIPQMTLEFSKTAVEAGTRRLAAKWSTELEQDLRNMNGIDVDAELTNAMSYEIQAEIDREMIARMLQTCLNAGLETGYSIWHAASADGRWSGERARDFYNRLIVEANRVAIRNRRGAANFVIGTPRVCAILESLPNFTWQPVAGNVNTAPTGIAKVGSVGGRFQIYRDTRTEAQQGGFNPVGQGYAATRPTTDYALLGYKGSEFYDTGIVYCPYIPVMVQRTIAPNDFSPRVGLLTRYGVVDHIFGANLYYHLLIVQGLGIGMEAGAAKRYL
jgi:hypothetical protein